MLLWTGFYLITALSGLQCYYRVPVTCRTFDEIAKQFKKHLPDNRGGNSITNHWHYQQFVNSVNERYKMHKIGGPRGHIISQWEGPNWNLANFSNVTHSVLNFTSRNSANKPCAYFRADVAKESFDFAIIPSECSWNNWTFPYEPRITFEKEKIYCQVENGVQCPTETQRTDNPKIKAESTKKQTCLNVYHCISGSSDCPPDQREVYSATCFPIGAGSQPSVKDSSGLCITIDPGQSPWICDGKNCTRHHCSCTTDLCNSKSNISHRHYEYSTTEATTEKAADDIGELEWILPAICVLICCAFSIFLYYRICRKSQQTPENIGSPSTRPNLNGAPPDEINLPLLRSRDPDDQNESINAAAQRSVVSIDLSKVVLDAVLAQGRYGVVWHALFDQKKKCAVKVFNTNDRASWENEKDIFSTIYSFTESVSNVLSFLGAGEVHTSTDRDLWIVTDYLETGSLSDYLRQNEISTNELFNIIHTMARGLSFLHGDQSKTITGKQQLLNKPAIAHRDFKSKNVLLKLDNKGVLSAVISDFGLAIKFVLGEAPGDSHPSVGTRRYMAPEILERAIAFNRDAFLRIDVYAFALVMWECLTRCKDLPGGAAPYKLPYEKELGAHPTLDDIQTYVVRRNLRPGFHHEGFDNRSWDQEKMFRNLCMTITQSWDEDPDARLSAGLVQIRVHQMITTLLPRTRRTQLVDKSNSPEETTPVNTVSYSATRNQMSPNNELNSANSRIEPLSNIGSNYSNHVAPEVRSLNADGTFTMEHRRIN
jgi:serine/threonine protein kinase